MLHETPRTFRTAARASLLLALSPVLLSAACSGTVDGSAGPIPLSTLPDSVADALCDALSGCCGAGFDPTTCRTAFSELYRRSFTEANPANYTYDANAAGACVAAFRTAFASCQNAAEAPSSCEATFTGRIPEGSPCTSDIECAAPDGSTPNCSGGLCEVRRRVQAGEACNASCIESGSSTSCSGSGSSLSGESRCFANDGIYCGDAGVCVPLLANGSACSGDEACSSNHCDFTTGVCAPKGNIGAPCSWDGDCLDTLHCGPTTCEARKPAGAPCSYNSDCASDSCDGAICSANSVGFLCTLAAGGGIPTP